MASNTPSNTLKEELKRLAEEKAAAEAKQKAQQAAMAGAQATPKPTESEAGSKIRFASSTSYEKGWKALSKAYNDQTDGKGVDTNGTLVFDTIEAAIKFFTAQALLGLKFCGSRVDNDGKPTKPELHVFSCGDNNLYYGSYAEITAQLTIAAETNPLAAAGLTEFKSMMPAPALAPEQTLREHLKKGRETDDPAETPDNAPSSRNRG